MAVKLLAERAVSYTLLDDETEEEREYSVSFDCIKSNTVVVFGPKGDMEIPLSDLPFLIRTLQEFQLLTQTFPNH